MPNAGKLTKAEEILEELPHARDVIELTQKGLGGRQIAHKLDIAYHVVRHIIEKYHQVYSLELQDYAEQVRLQSIMRLNYMYGKAAEYAFPMEADDPHNPLRKENPETGEIETEFYKGSTSLLSIMVRILKEQRAWYELEHNLSKHDDNRRVNIEKVEVTIRQSSELYGTALSQLQEEWMNPLLEQDINTIYLDNEVPQSALDEDDELRKLHQRLEEIERNLPSTGGDEDGEEED